MLHQKQQHIKDIYGKEPETLDELAEACIAVIGHNSVPVVGFAWNIETDARVSNSHDAPVDGYTNWGGDNHRGDVKSYPGFRGRVWIRYETDPDFMRCSENFNKTLTHTGSGGGGSYDGLWTNISTASYKTRFRKDPGNYRSKFIYKYPAPKCYSWDYRIFQSDFPALCLMPGILLSDEYPAFEKEQDELEIWHRLQGKYYRREKFTHHHAFKWEDPATKAKDIEFLETYTEEYMQKELV